VFFQPVDPGFKASVGLGLCACLDPKVIHATSDMVDQLTMLSERLINFFKPLVHRLKPLHNGCGQVFDILFCCCVHG